MFSTRQRIPRLTCDQFDSLVYRWNGLKPVERKDHRETCLAHGHDWTEASFSERGNETYVCRRCLKYDHHDR